MTDKTIRLDDQIPESEKDQELVYPSTPVVDDRKPISTVKKEYSTLQPEATDPGKVKDHLRLVLPNEYDQALRLTLGDLEEPKELYHNAATDVLREEAPVARSSERLLPRLKKKFMGMFADNSGPSADKTPDLDDPIGKHSVEEEIIRRSLNEIFQDPQLLKDKAKTEIEKRIELDQRTRMEESLAVVARGTERQIGYQDTVLSKYHQKSLELQYLHYFAAKDLLSVTKLHSQKAEDALSLLVKNSSLPEAVKIQKSELFGQVAKHRLIVRSLDYLGEKAGQYRKNVVANLPDYISKGRYDGNRVIEGVRGLANKLIDWKKSRTTRTGLGGLLDQSLRDTVNGIDPDIMGPIEEMQARQELQTAVVQTIPGQLSQILHWVMMLSKNKDPKQFALDKLKSPKAIQSRVTPVREQEPPLETTKTLSAEQTLVERVEAQSTPPEPKPLSTPVNDVIKPAKTEKTNSELWDEAFSEIESKPVKSGKRKKPTKANQGPAIGFAPMGMPPMPDPAQGPDKNKPSEWSRIKSLFDRSYDPDTPFYYETVDRLVDAYRDESKTKLFMMNLALSPYVNAWEYAKRKAPGLTFSKPRVKQPPMFPPVADDELPSQLEVYYNDIARHYEERGELPEHRLDDIRLLATKDKDYKQLLDKVMALPSQKKEKGSKSVAGDRDGDGIRDGSYEDLKRRRANKEKPTAEKPQKETKEKKGGIGGLLATFFPMLLSGITSIGDKILGLGKVLGLAKAAGGVMDVLGGLGGGGGGPKKGLLRRGVGLLGRGISGVAKGAWAATKAADGFLLRGLGAASLKAAGGLLAGVGSIISSPVVLGGLAVAAVGYAGYKLYKHFTENPGPLFRIRMAQYGFHHMDKPSLKPLAQMEQMFWDKTSLVPGGGVRINERAIDVKELLKLFEIDLSDPEDSDTIEHAKAWTHWLETRFMPVFKTHAAAVMALGGGVDFANVEEKLEPKKALEVVEQIKMSEATEAFNDTTSPFEGSSLSQTAEDVAERVKEAQATYKEKLSEKDEKKDLIKAAAQDAKLPKPDSPIDAAIQATKTTTAVPLDSAIKRASFGPSSFGELQSLGVKLQGFGKMVVSNSIIGTVYEASGVNLKNLTVGQSVRMKTYGLTKLESNKVNLLIELEQRAFKDIKFDGQKQGIWAGIDEQYFDRYKSRFGVRNAVDEEFWYRWWIGRFLPVLVQFATSVRSRANVPLEDAEKRIRGEELKTVLGEVISASSTLEHSTTTIWAVKESPWPDYELNTDRSSAQALIDSIDVKASLYGEDLDKDGNPKATVAVDQTDREKRGVVGNAVDAVKNTMSNLYENAKEKASSVWSSIKTAASDVVDGAAQAVNTVSNAVGMGDIAPVKGNAAVNKKLLIAEMAKLGITDPKEQAAFMAQMDHESGGFKVLSENLNYRASRLREVFPKYYRTNAEAQSDAGNPMAIANRVYGGRMGNSEAGDGFKYRGRGLIQLTGKSNYIEASKALGIDLVNNPDAASTPEVAAKIAGWFWKKSGAGQAALRGDLRTSRKLINGGFNGMSDVQGKYNGYLGEALAGRLKPDGTETVAQTDATPGAAETTAVSTSTAPAPGATGTETTASAPPPPTATGLTTPAASGLPAASAEPAAMKVSTPVADEAVTAPAPPVVSPVIKRAEIADKQSSAISEQSQQQYTEMTQVMNKQLSIQMSMEAKLSSLDGNLLKLLEAIAGRQSTPSAPTNKPVPNVTTTAPMSNTPVSVGRKTI